MILVRGRQTLLTGWRIHEGATVMRTTRLILGVLGAASVCLLVGSAHLSAHHAFSAEFDANKPITLRGTVAKVEWINPHSWIHVDVKSPDGKVERWMIEGGNPTVMLRRRLSKDSLPVCTQFRGEGYQANGDPLRANMRDPTFPFGPEPVMRVFCPRVLVDRR